MLARSIARVSRVGAVRPAFAAASRFESTAVAAPTEEKKKEETFVEKYGLNDWKIAVPLGMAIGIPAITNEMVVISAETQLLACFLLFCGTAYNQLGGTIAKVLDDYREAIVKEQRQVEDAQIEQLRQQITEHEKMLTLNEDLSKFFDVQDESRRLAASAANLEAKHAFRATMVRKLDAVAAVEEAAVQKMKGRVAEFVINDVNAAFASDKKLKENALAHAISVLSNPSGKIGKDIVGEVFVSSIQKYKAEYQKTPAEKDPVLVQLKQEVDAIVKA